MDSRSVDLKDKTPANNVIEFVRAEVPSSGSPFVRVYYAQDGKVQVYALRLDIDKQVFLDRLENPADDKFVRDSAKAVATVVGATYSTSTDIS